MQTTGLLNADQLEMVFINLEELISSNSQFTEKLRSALLKAASVQDEVSHTRVVLSNIALTLLTSFRVAR